MSLIWQNVCFVRNEPIFDKLFSGSCHQSQEKSNILDNLNGRVHFGELTAIMGPSGAGKSTLLNFITQGKSYKGCDGQLIVQHRNNEKIRASFISQEEKDHLLLNLTVYESLLYASEIKNPSSITKSKHDEMIEGILGEMGLAKIKNCVAGKCSGGERKRLAISLELTAEKKPNVLILDEPTSGLDSYSGLNLIFQLRKLADIRGMAIISTIHQPSYEMLEYFHRVYIISKAGDCLYNGPPGEIAQHLQNYNFHSNSGIANPADSIIKVASSVHRDDDDKLEKIEQPNIACEMYQYLIKNANAEELEKNKLICLKMAEDIRLKWETVDVTNPKHLYNNGLCKSSHWTNWKLWELLKRAARTSILKQKKLIIIRFALHAVVAILLVGLYEKGIGKDDGCFIQNGNKTDVTNVTDACNIKQNPRDDKISVQNVKFQFFSLLFLMFAALMPTVLTFSSEIKVFLNEHRNGWYTTSSYYLSKTIIEMPCQLIFPCCYTYFLYVYSNQIDMDEWQGGVMGFQSWRYSSFLAITILSGFIAQGMGFLIGILCVKSFNLTIILSTSVLLFLFLFSGFFVKTIQMGPFPLMMTNLSFIRFSFESLVVILYGFNRCQDNTSLQENASSNVTLSAVLYTFDLNDDHVLHGVSWLISHLVIIRVLAFIVLKYYAEPTFLRLPSFDYYFFKSIFGKKKTKLNQDKTNTASVETVQIEL